MTTEEDEIKGQAMPASEMSDNEKDDPEYWVDIKGYEGLYQVSTHGRIYSVPRRGTRGGVLRQGLSRNGYQCVALCKDGICKSHMVHRLVAENLIENPDNLPEVNHLDECKTNNHASNLEWCTRLENLHHGTGIERMAAAHDYATSSKKSAANHDYDAVAKKMRKPVVQFDLNGDVIKCWDGVTVAANALGISAGNISSACKKTKPCIHGKSHGFIWRYEEDM